MKPKPIHSLLLLVLGFSLAFATEKLPAARPNPERYAKQIAAFAEQAPEKGGIVFTGSSSIRRWESLQEDFPGLPVLNHGFGGSVANDLIAYIDTLVLRDEPRVLVVYTGGNDINAGLSVPEAFADYTRFVGLVHEKLPKTRIIINSVKVSIKRVTQMPEALELNHLLEAWAKDKSWVRYLDSSSYLLDAGGQPIRHFYVDDLMHLNPAGYTEWAKRLRPVLHEEWEKMRHGAAENAPTPRPKPERYAKQIAAFARQEPEKGGIVFTGNSNVARWKTLKEDFPGLPVLNRGFGGSVANDLIAYADTVVLRHEPKIVVVYTGGNDINAKLTPQETFDDYTRFAALVHEKLPGARIIVNSVKASIKRHEQIPQVLEVNRLLEAWAKDKDWIRYVDCTTLLLDPAGQPIREFYVDDLVHLSPAGYAEWIKQLHPILHEEWEKVRSGNPR